MLKYPKAGDGKIKKEKTMGGIKRKLKAKIVASEPKNRKIEPSNVAKIIKKDNAIVTKVNVPQEIGKSAIAEEISERFPVLKNKQLVDKILSVPMTNNQKGRIRQQIRDRLRSTSDRVIPEVIHDRIQEILKSTENLTDIQLRRLRILYNMLKNATENENIPSGMLKKKKKKSLHEKKSSKNKRTENDENKTLTETGNKIKIKKKDSKGKDKKMSFPEKNEDVKDDNAEKENEIKLKSKDSKEDKQQKLVKKKGPKRYVVFIGNLPVGINKEKIKQHFSMVSDNIKDVRIPETEGVKSCFAYLELKDEISYELALSKHHSMLGNKRINVMYTTQKKGKISKTEAKHKVAKLAALQKSGKLLGSVPLNRKRSQRRKKMKEARAKQEAGAI